MTAPTRPPRPVHIDPDVLAEVCRTMGMPAREIIEVVDTDAGRIVTTHDGCRSIIVPRDKPDALGQHGVLIYDAPLNLKGPRYTTPDVAVVQHEDWTLDDLDLAANRINQLPAPVSGPTGGPSRLPWVGSDPVRARALWRRIAAGLNVEPRLAVYQDGEAAACRQIILTSGWLSDTEAAQL